MNHGEHPLYATREEALNARGEVYEHYKGGIYRIHEKSFFSNLDDGRPRFKLIKKDL